MASSVSAQTRRSILLKVLVSHPPRSLVVVGWVAHVDVLNRGEGGEEKGGVQKETSFTDASSASLFDHPSFPRLLSS
jgi:hypothetical protein